MLTKAIEEFRKAIEIEPNNLTIRKKMAKTLKRLGWFNIEKQDFDHAYQVLTESLSLNLEDFQTKVLLAQASAGIGKFKKAIQLVDTVLQDSPNRIDALYVKARVLTWARKYDEAVSAYENILEIDSENEGARFGLEEIDALRSISLEFSSGYLIDSFDFERVWLEQGIKYLVLPKVSMIAGFRYWRFNQTGSREIERNDYFLGIRYFVNQQLNGAIEFSHQNFSSDGSINSVKLFTQIKITNKFNVYGSASRTVPINDNILTINNKFFANVYGLGIDHSLLTNWSVQASLLSFLYSDRNQRTSREFSFSYLKPPSINLRFIYTYLNFEKKRFEYWTPRNYETLSSIFDWRSKVGAKVILGVVGRMTYFTEGNSLGYGVEGHITFNWNAYSRVLLLGIYDSAKAEHPWRGKKIDIKVKYLL